MKGAEEYAAPHRLPGLFRGARLRRDRRQRASPDRLWHDAGAQPHRQRAHPAHQEGQDRDPRPRAAARRTTRSTSPKNTRCSTTSRRAASSRASCAASAPNITRSGTNPYFSHERFHEAHDLIVKAWTEPGPFSFDGEHFNIRYVNLWPRPYQQPHPPIWIPSQGSSETVVWAVAPRPQISVPGHLLSGRAGDALSQHLSRRRRGNTATRPSGDQLGWASPIYVAETDERAREEAKRGLETLFNDYLRMTSEMLIPPGYTSQASTKASSRCARTSPRASSFMSAEKLVSGGTAVVGSPKTVRAAIERNAREDRLQRP